MISSIQIDAPYLTVGEYAKRTGLSEQAVTTKCRNGELPVMPRKNDRCHYYVNVALLTKQALEADY